MEKKSKVDKRANWDNSKWHKHYRNQAIGCKVGKYACSVTPILILFITKWEEYFKILDQTSQIKFSIGCILAVIVGAVAVMQDIKKTEDPNKQRILMTAGWWMAWGIVVCFQTVFNDLATILLYEACGQVGTFVCAELENNRKTWADNYKEGVVTEKTFKNLKKEEKGIPTD